MKKIILAVATTFAMLAVSGTAEARRSENTQYSHHEVDNWDPLEGIIGGDGKNWSVSPRIHAPMRHASRYQTYTRHFAGKPSSSIVAYGRMLQHSGFRVSEHPAFGGVHHVHHGWAHYAGRALDINIGHGAVEASNPSMRHRFDALAARARAAGYTVLWKVAGHFNHIHIQK